jgi:RecB family endonuclease NucS
VQPSEDEDGPSTTAFAYESDLRNFLSKNLHVLDAGLRLYEQEGITGVEFPVGGRFVDILALDANGAYVVIELKVSRGYDRAVGQLRRYMGWIAKSQADPGQAVRGIIIAREISQDLILACSGLLDVELFEYEMSVSVRRVES